MNFCNECVRRKKCDKKNITYNRGWTYKGKPCCDNMDLEHWGIWNGMRKEFQFGIDASSERAANNALFKKIGYDSYKWRFEAKRLPKEEYKRFIVKPPKVKHNINVDVVNGH